MESNLAKSSGRIRVGSILETASGQIKYKCILCSNIFWESELFEEHIIAAHSHAYVINEVETNDNDNTGDCVVSAIENNIQSQELGQDPNIHQVTENCVESGTPRNSSKPVEMNDAPTCSNKMISVEENRMKMEGSVNKKDI
ncbi:uncharacterized protein LOC119690210 [Teleopsis dalmanni]|uniref:uncharacterized protein LOC119690210 n=1 Tax=Teleopsis dalmanni TaxID=139649 RepID=UPI000D32A967|nr:uncharacterized protein LOC119690210 [Teleopsis dalmanni]